VGILPLLVDGSKRLLLNDRRIEIMLINITNMSKSNSCFNIPYSVSGLILRFFSSSTAGIKNFILVVL